MERLIRNAGGIEAPERLHESEVRSDRDWVVVVYDNDHNTVEQVILILILATGCTQDEAEMETWEIHNLGRSVVHHGAEEHCHKVAAIIASIGIRVEVYKEE